MVRYDLTKRDLSNIWNNEKTLVDILNKDIDDVKITNFSDKVEKNNEHLIFIITFIILLYFNYLLYHLKYF